MKLDIPIAVLLMLLASSQTADGEIIFNETPSGTLKGRIDLVEERKVIKFLNIPFAKPPTGDLRFRKPEPYGTWEEVREATEFGNICPQSKGVEMVDEIEQRNKGGPGQSEDCLTLNVYIPDDMVMNKPRTVMVWIYGGGFIMGEASSNDGSFIVLQGNVIFVSINYRVGAFGFFSTDDEASPGNYGLMDQILALEWVKENIHAFGGDPSSITLFGESAGGLSISHHLLNIDTEGLFKRVIIQSGSNFGDTEMCRHVRESAMMMGIKIGCVRETTTLDTLNSQELVECLRTKSMEDIVEAQNKVIEVVMESGINCFGATVVDGTIISRPPKDILSEENSKEFDYFRSIDILAGTTSLEGGIFSYLITAMQEAMDFNASEGVPSNVACDIIIPMFTLFSQGQLDAYGSDQVNLKLCERIVGSDKITTGRNIFDFMGDVYFTAPTVRLLDAHSHNNFQSKTYQFLFSLEPKQDVAVERLHWVKGYGSDHGTDELVMFGPDGISKRYGGAFGDISDFRNQMITYWTNFAKTG